MAFPEEGQDPAQDEAALEPLPEPDPETEPPKYWAAFPTDEIGSELVDRVREYYETLRESNLIELYATVHAHFYSLSQGGGGHESSTIVEFGEDGEKLGVRSNQLRSLVRYMLTSTTADRPAISPKAVNTTVQALAQVGTARRVLEYYDRTKKHRKKLTACALRALLYGKSYLWQGWDPSAGPNGDLFSKACSPLDTVIDLERDEGDHDWYLFRRGRNRFDMIAQYAGSAPATPELAQLRDDLESIQVDCLPAEMVSKIAFGFKRREGSDQIFEYHFLHRKTPAMPQGRYVIFAGEGTVLFDGDLPYSDLPVTEMVPEEFMEAGSIGYASAWDLVGLQECYDSLLSTCMTNFDAFGSNDMLLPDGVELGVEEVRDGLNVIRYPQGEQNKPSILEKFSLREEVFKLREWIKDDLEVNSGVNSVARGEPEASLKSGAALALVQAQALHFLNGFVEAYVHLIEDSGTVKIRILKRYANQEVLSAIAGPNDPDGLVAFSSKDIDQIDRIEAEQVNPLFRTGAGKFDVANNLLERGLLTDPTQYFQVLETGRLEVATDPGRKEDLMVMAENEILMRGPACEEIPGEIDPMTGMQGPPTCRVPEVPVVWTDDPVKHLRGVKAIIDSPEARKNPAVMKAAVYHAMDHLKQWQLAPKDGLMLLGYPMPPVMPGDPDPMQDDPGAAAAQQAAQPGANPNDPAGQKKQKPMGNGTASGQSAPDQGSGMPSLPKPAQSPLPQ